MEALADRADCPSSAEPARVHQTSTAAVPPRAASATGSEPGPVALRRVQARMAAPRPTRAATGLLARSLAATQPAAPRRPAFTPRRVGLACCPTLGTVRAAPR